MKGLQLLATGGALPSRVVTNEDLRRQVDTSDEWITTRTGICQRYYCTENEDAATLAVTAARQALTRSGLAANDIACCVVATLSAPTATPSIACRVQAALGLPENRQTVARLRQMGCVDERTVIVIHHFSHNCGQLQEELEREVAEDGYLVAYDGMTLTI